MKLTIFLITLLLSMHVRADEKSRSEIIGRIVAAQHLQQMFEQQQQQSKASSEEFGKELFQKMLTDLGVPEGKINPSLQKAFSDYMARCSSMFSVDELVATWSSVYGREMSEDELSQALAYYESPVGRKDVQASQVAMIGFSQIMTTEGQRRMQQSVSKLIADIKSAVNQ